MDKSAFYPYFVVWVIALGIVVRQSMRQPSVGLMFAYCFQMWMLHWIGAAAHAWPTSELPDSETVLLGFSQSAYAIASLAAGSLFLGPALSRLFLRGTAASEEGVDLSLPRSYIILGLISYFIFAPTIGRLPGLNAVGAVAAQLVVVGCCLRCYIAWRTKGRRALLPTLIPALAIPMATVVVQGFLGFGVIALSIILLFTAQFFRPRWLLALGFLAAAYIGLSVYISYMRDRDDLRATVWGGAAISERIASFQKTLTNIDWFDPNVQDHLAFIDSRLDQNLLVGAAVSNLNMTGNYANGGTLVDALLAMIPRLIWPSKPMSAGSAGLVSQFTGMTFAEKTSVGVGPVLEFYGNFGTWGVIGGFFILGSLIKALDLSAGINLAAGNWQSFTAFFLVGISFLNVSGSLVEVTAGAMASLAVAAAVRRVLKRNPTKPKELMSVAIG